MKLINTLLLNMVIYTAVWLGSRKRNVCISQSALQKAKQMSKPGRAVRFLMRCVFSKEEMSSSNTLGDPTRGLKKLDPNKLSAIRGRGRWLSGLPLTPHHIFFIILIAEKLQMNKKRITLLFCP